MPLLNCVVADRTAYKRVPVVWSDVYVYVLGVCQLQRTDTYAKLAKRQDTSVAHVHLDVQRRSCERLQANAINA